MSALSAPNEQRSWVFKPRKRSCTSLDSIKARPSEGTNWLLILGTGTQTKPQKRGWPELLCPSSFSLHSFRIQICIASPYITSADTHRVVLNRVLKNMLHSALKGGTKAAQAPRCLPSVKVPNLTV